MSPTRVGINLLWLATGEVGGTEDYCIGLLRAFSRDPEARRHLRIVVYLNGAVDATYPDLARTFETRRAPITGRHRLTRVLAEHTWLVAATRRDRLQIVHHLGGTMPFLRGTPGVALVHDLQPWAIPQNFSRIKRAYLHATVPPTVRRARAVTTLSRWVKRDMHERLGVPLERIVCVPPGAERLVGRIDAPIDEAAVLARHDIGDRPFFLYPVITYPHKNHETLIAAFARITDAHSHALLVLPGGEGPAEDTVMQAIRREGVGSQVRRLGRVPNATLEVLYRSTTALTFPSRYEGFGMPILEVMHHGRPVVAARAGALPEVVGDGGVLVEPDDIAGWAAVLDELLRDPVKWRELAAAAEQRAAAYTWEHTVGELVGLYRRATKGPLQDVGS